MCGTEKHTCKKTLSSSNTFIKSLPKVYTKLYHLTTSQGQLSPIDRGKVVRDVRDNYKNIVVVLKLSPSIFRIFFAGLFDLKRTAHGYCATCILIESVEEEWFRACYGPCYFSARIPEHWTQLEFIKMITSFYRVRVFQSSSIFLFILSLPSSKHIANQPFQDSLSPRRLIWPPIGGIP